MVGQWFGFTDGTNKGIAILNVEGRVYGQPDTWGGRVMFTDKNDTNLNFYCAIQFRLANNKIQGKLYDFYIFDYQTQQLINTASYGNLYPDSSPPTRGEVSADVQDNQISGNWKTDINTEGTFVVEKSQAGERATPGIPLTWDNFKEKFGKPKAGQRVLFRGQKNISYRLRTTFHRNGGMILFAMHRMT